MREGDAFGESVRINHMFDSSGLNLACEGLLLGKWSEGCKDTPIMKLHLVLRTFTGITTVGTFINTFIT
jgi:hypothetical protein